MSEIELQTLRLKKKHEQSIVNQNKNKKEQNFFSKAITHVLISIIFVLSSLIYIHWSENNFQNYKKSVFETNLSFTAIENWYEKYFGSVLPIELSPNTAMVNNIKNDFQNGTKYKDGIAFNMVKGSSISTLNSGILVFLGEKEGYGNVAIIQGIDGVDIWYGNIENVSLNIYDYVEKGTLLGSSKEDTVYFVFQKDGQYLDYEEYKSQI